MVVLTFSFRIQLPLGFFAAFFGMNNADINDAPWMSLREQIGYMCKLSFALPEFPTPFPPGFLTVGQ